MLTVAGLQPLVLRGRTRGDHVRHVMPRGRWRRGTERRARRAVARLRQKHWVLHRTDAPAELGRAAHHLGRCSGRAERDYRRRDKKRWTAGLHDAGVRTVRANLEPSDIVCLPLFLFSRSSCQGEGAARGSFS